MQLKHTILVLTAAGLLTTQAYASEAQVQAVVQPAQPAVAFTGADLGALFEQTDRPMQLAALSEAEMQETEGALLPAWAVAIGVRSAWGAVAGGVRYAVSYGGSPSWNWRDQFRSVGYGALGGAIGWNKPAAAVLGTGFSAAGMRWGP